MNLSKFIVLFCALTGLTINLNAQSDKKLSEQEQARKQQLILELRQKQVGAKMVKERSIQVQTDRYNHREAEIMAKLNVPQIPADFPVYKPEYSNEEYTSLMNKWYDANPTLVKKESSNSQK